MAASHAESQDSQTSTRFVGSDASASDDADAPQVPPEEASHSETSTSEISIAQVPHPQRMNTDDESDSPQKESQVIVPAKTQTATKKGADARKGAPTICHRFLKFVGWFFVLFVIYIGYCSLFGPVTGRHPVEE